MIVLGVDSSAKSASCALIKDGILLGESFINNGYTHSQTLLPMINNLFKSLSISPKDVDLYSVNAGPGSFTGVRIGAATVKGLAFSENKPCAAVSSLECLAQNVPHFDGIICPVMDARRKQVYNALFEGKQGKITRLTEDRAISVSELEHDINLTGKNTIFVGDGAYLCYNSFENKDKISISPQGELLARGVAVARLGLSAFENGSVCDCFSLSPVYLRPSQAERELKNRKR